MATLSAPSIEELIQDTRNMLSQPDPNNSTWSDEELSVYLNEGVRRYFAEAVMSFEGLFTTTYPLDLVADTEAVDLPSDFYEVKAVYRKTSGGYQVLPSHNMLLRNISTTDSGSGDLYTPSYSLRKNQLILNPRPSFSETDGLLIEYVQFPESMVTGGDTLTSQVSPVFKDLIIAYAVYKAKVKESLTNNSNTPALALQNLNDLFTAFKEAIHQRSAYPSFVGAFDPENGA